MEILAGRLRFMGAALAPINSNERALLTCIFKAIEKYLGRGKVGKIIESLFILLLVFQFPAFNLAPHESLIKSLVFTEIWRVSKNSFLS